MNHFAQPKPFEDTKRQHSRILKISNNFIFIAHLAWLIFINPEVVSIPSISEMKRRVDSEMEIDLINGMLWQRMSMHDPPASRTKKFARVEEDDFDDDSTAEHATAMVPEVEEDDEDVDNPSVWLIVRLASGIKVKGEFPVSTPFQVKLTSPCRALVIVIGLHFFIPSLNSFRTLYATFGPVTPPLPYCEDLSGDFAMLLNVPGHPLTSLTAAHCASSA